jgi:hypothetical protein
MDNDHRFTTFQLPNLNLVIVLLAALAGAMLKEGFPHTAARLVYVIAGIIWSVREIFTGVNWFRRLLGLLILVLITAPLFMHGLK